MSPQPMGHVFNGDIHLNFYANVLAQRPQIAALVAQIVSQWSVVEMEMGNVFASLIGANNDAAMIAYDSLRTAGAKHGAMQALAQSRLAEDDMKIFRATITAIERVENKRNVFAHSLIMSRDELTDGIILVDPRQIVKARYANMFHTTRPEPFLNINEEIKEKSLIYRELDLRSILTEINGAQTAAFYLSGFCITGFEDQARSDLLSSPSVAKELNRIERRENKNTAP